MACIRTDLKTIHQVIRPGDIIAFGGSTTVSKLIKLTTDAVVSHVGIVIDSSPDHNSLSFMEATIADKKVVTTNLYEKMKTFEGDIWLLPLKASLRSSFNLQNFHTFLETHHNKPYDTKQALMSAFDQLDHFPEAENGLTYSDEDFTEIFCSELVAGSLEASGMIAEVNASEITPIEICGWNIFEDKYYLLQGEKDVITPYNVQNVK